MIKLELSNQVRDLERIVELQRLNRPHAVPADLWETEGFVTMEYTVEQLQQMSGPYRHVVAKFDGIVVGYALVMLKECRASFPFLDDMFGEAEAGIDGSYFVMGQVCVDGAFRGKGIFRKLYHALREQMRADFDCVVTEVSTRNERSMRAHQALGFKNVKDESLQTSEWRVIAWDWT